MDFIKYNLNNYLHLFINICGDDQLLYFIHKLKMFKLNILSVCLKLKIILIKGQGFSECHWGIFNLVIKNFGPTTNAN